MPRRRRRIVVDTNVPVTAKSGTDLQCKLTCIERLEGALNGKYGPVVIDTGGEVLSEYRRRLSPSGQPSIGDQFYRQIILNRGNSTVVLEVEIQKHEGSYREFPATEDLSKFHSDDRKFVALAIAGQASIWNATDSDWHEHRVALRTNGVSIIFLCGVSAFRRKIS